MNETNQARPLSPEFRELQCALVVELSDKIEELAKTRLKGHTETERHQMVYEMVATCLGFADGVSTLHGASRGAMDYSLRSSVEWGRRMALAQHKNEGCAGCDVSTALQLLVEPH